MKWKKKQNTEEKRYNGEQFTGEVWGLLVSWKEKPWFSSYSTKWRWICNLKHQYKNWSQGKEKLCSNAVDNKADKLCWSQWWSLLTQLVMLAPGIWSPPYPYIHVYASQGWLKIVFSMLHNLSLHCGGWITDGPIWFEMRMLFHANSISKYRFTGVWGSSTLYSSGQDTIARLLYPPRDYSD